VLIAFFLLAGLACAEDPCPSIDVFFSPKGGCTDAIIREITNAKSAIMVSALSLTSMSIGKALIDAHKRGVKVEIILNKEKKISVYGEADFFYNEGIPVWIDSIHGINHNKIMVMDGSTVITGSFNFTKRAEENNAENLVVIRDKKLVEKYVDNWRIHREHSQPYKGKNLR
jgi:phosphatidylserine/phosphatidylglycerophosphate/cardiolipin synthase-like enzyme